MKFNLHAAINHSFFLYLHKDNKLGCVLSLPLKQYEMTEYDAYIFDLDGTLLDTLGDLAASVNAALEACQMPCRTIDEVRAFVGNGVRVLMQRAVPDGTDEKHMEEALEMFRSYYLVHSMDTTCPYEGIIPLLESLKSRGKKIAIVSNKFQKATQELCAHFFGSLVDVAIGESETIRKKPAPDTVVEAMRLLQVDKSQAVYIGDSDVDIETARNCSLPCISVLWGFRSREFLLRHGATTFVESPEDILASPT